MVLEKHSADWFDPGRLSTLPESLSTNLPRLSARHAGHEPMQYN
jgi:hypothetical protein